MNDTVQLNVSGVEECVELLNRAKDKKVRNAMRSAISRAGTVLLQTVRPLVPMTTREATGLLRRSMGKKDSKQFAKKPWSMVGPRRGFAQTIAPISTRRAEQKRIRKGILKVSAKGKRKDPVRYAHLVGGGHKSKSGYVQGRPFLAHARFMAAAQMNNVIKLVLTQKLVSEIRTNSGEE